MGLCVVISFGESMITILVGMPGAGKSTYAQTVPGEIINQDKLGDRKICIKRAKELLSEGKDVIIDRTNISRKQRAIWTNLAKEFKVEQIQVVELRISPELAIERVKNRKDHPTIKEDTSLEKIQEIVRRFVNEYEAPHMDEGFTSYTIIHVDNLV
jgi:predicted kinase